jgi:acyl carrier protein
LFADIRELLISGYDADSHLITHTATLGGDLGLDSIDIVDFIMDLEDAYDIQITDREFDGAKTLGDLAALLEEKGCAPVFFAQRRLCACVGEPPGRTRRRRTRGCRNRTGDNAPAAAQPPGEATALKTDARRITPRPRQMARGQKVPAQRTPKVTLTSGYKRKPAECGSQWA